ncbi:hypothetical protein KLQUMA228M_14140 [Klebsiella quasipneumoniae subsp. quasipneumoniae]|nr:Uncharacterised protein [Klebsiella quasipneumoniae]VGB56119.1 Uncharacterised protein [Klebsiella pneumoniae]VGG37625.1 Uncharacterised protein [Klebsiella quasipneumoniae]
MLSDGSYKLIWRIKSFFFLTFWGIRIVGTVITGFVIRKNLNFFLTLCRF